MASVDTPNLLGGFLVDQLGWRRIFLVSVPIGVILFTWSYALMPRGERTDPARCEPGQAVAVH